MPPKVISFKILWRNSTENVKALEMTLTQNSLACVFNVVLLFVRNAEKSVPKNVSTKLYDIFSPIFLKYTLISAIPK